MFSKNILDQPAPPHSPISSQRRSIIRSRICAPPPTSWMPPLCKGRHWGWNSLLWSQCQHSLWSSEENWFDLEFMIWNLAQSLWSFGQERSCLLLRWGIPSVGTSKHWRDTISTFSMDCSILTGIMGKPTSACFLLLPGHRQGKRASSGHLTPMPNNEFGQQELSFKLHHIKRLPKGQNNIPKVSMKQSITPQPT